MSQPIAASKSAMQKFMDVVAKVENKVPHPAVIFLILIAIVVVLSEILQMLRTGISYKSINPETSQTRDGDDPREESALLGARQIEIGCYRTGGPRRREDVWREHRCGTHDLQIKTRLLR